MKFDDLKMRNKIIAGFGLVLLIVFLFGLSYPTD